MFALDPNLWSNSKNINEEDNAILCRPFSESKIKDALFQMERNKITGPDSIPIEFYQTCWDIIKEDIVQLFNDFHDGELDISRLNYDIITLLPKIAETSKIH
uniref:Uncharacterized protein n=1 Tax=Arundo donax TaxID=35708 RepID=A0A0A9C160_ARUDO